MRIQIAEYAADYQTTPQTREVSWSDLVALVTTHAATPCTPTTCAGGQCHRKKVAAWSPVQIEGSRLGRNVRAVTALVVDVDHASPADLEASLLGLRDSGLAWCAATSHQHTEDSPRYRLVLALSRPATPEEYPRLRRAALRRLRLPGDPKTGDLSRIYYLPTSREGCPPESASWSGAPLDVDAELAAAPPEPESDLPARDGGPGDWLESTSPISAQDSARLTALLGRLPPRGQGRGATYLAFALIFHDFGLGIEDGWPYLAAWNAGCGAPHEPAELERQYYRCAGRDHEHPRGWQRGGDLVAGIVAGLTRPAEGTWDGELARAASEVAAALGTVAARASEPLGESYEALAARDEPGVEWLVDGLVKRGGVAVLGGRSKIGKSWILTSLALAVATGRPALGSIPVAAPRRVFYLYAEDPSSDVRSHAAAILAGMGASQADVGGRWTVQPQGRHLDLTRDADVALVVASVRWAGGADLVVLEPLRDLHTAKESDSDEMAPVMRRLHLVGQLLGGATVLVAHHEGKPGDSRGRKGGERLRGSGAIYASASAMISVTPVAQTPSTIETLVEVETRGARSRADFGLVLTIEDDSRGQSTRAAWQVGRPREPGEGAAPATKHPGDAGAVLAELERHALATRADLARWRDRGCRCPAGAVLHAQDLYQSGAHRIEISRARQRVALAALLAAGKIARDGGEHGPLRISHERAGELARELSGRGVD